MDPIQVFICEDDTLFRELIVDYVSRQPDLAVAGAAAYKHQLLYAVESTPIDVLLLDVNLTGINYDGIEAAIELQASHPDLKIIILSSLQDDEVISHAIAYGRVNNYITKEHYRDLPEAIRSAAKGESGLHHSSAGKLRERLSSIHMDELKQKITPLQLQILTMLDQGLSRKEIADRLVYNEQSINNELCKISKVIKGRFPYMEWLRLKKHNTKHLIELAKSFKLLETK